MSYDTDLSDEETPSTPAPGRRRGRPKRSHTVAKVITITTLSLALVTGMWVALTLRDLQNNITVYNPDAQLTKRPLPVVEGAINILVMGSDSRAGDNNIDGLTGAGARSDTTILLHLSEDRSRVFGVSIPRDTLVTRPDCILKDGSIAPGGERQMWNAAFQIGGPACTIQQFEQVTGIRINHSVVVDFSGFKDMVDAVGGVEVCLTEPIEDPAHGIRLEAGRREITGNEALSFVRVRYGVGDGSDIGRVKRQQAFVASMVNKVLSADTLANPWRVQRFAKSVTESIVLSQSLGRIREIAGLAVQFRDVDLKRVRFLTVPWQYDVLDPNRVALKPEAADLWSAIVNDEPLSKELIAGSINSNKPPTGGGNGGNGGNGGDDENDEVAAAGLCA